MSAVSEQAPANRLRKNSLGVGAITFMVISAAAPLPRSPAVRRSAC